MKCINKRDKNIKKVHYRLQYLFTAKSEKLKLKLHSCVKINDKHLATTQAKYEQFKTTQMIRQNVHVAPQKRGTKIFKRIKGNIQSL